MTNIDYFIMGGVVGITLYTVVMIVIINKIFDKLNIENA